MRITMLATAAAIALLATVGSVSADQLTTPKQFTTLNGVKAVPMSSAQLSAVKGMDHHFTVTTPGQNGFIDPNNSTSAQPFNFNMAGTVERFGTDFHHDGDEGGDQSNYVQIGTGMFAPSYLGLRLHACPANNVIATGGCS
jgi:hypothetical protein